MTPYCKVIYEASMVHKLKISVHNPNGSKYIFELKPEVAIEHQNIIYGS